MTATRTELNESWLLYYLRRNGCSTQEAYCMEIGKAIDIINAIAIAENGAKQKIRNKYHKMEDILFNLN